MKRIILIFILFYLCVDLYPQTNSAGAFLRRGIDSKALAIGGAYTSVTDGVSSVYWNPAGLSGVQQNEFTGMYSLLTLDRSEYFAGIAHNFTDLFTVGAGLYRFGVNNIDGRDENGQKTGTFDDSENSIMVGFSREFMPFEYGRFSLGLTLKYLVHSLYTNAANGFGFDLGFQTTVLEQFRIGIVLQDLGSYLKWDTESSVKEEIPTVFRFGISYFPEFYPMFASIDYYKVSGQQEVIRLGTGIKFLNSFGVKAGYNGETPTFGAFVIVPYNEFLFQFDYATGKDVLENDYIHYLTLSFNF